MDRTAAQKMITDLVDKLIALSNVCITPHLYYPQDRIYALQRMKIAAEELIQQIDDVLEEESNNDPN